MIQSSLIFPNQPQVFVPINNLLKSSFHFTDNKFKFDIQKSKYCTLSIWVVQNYPEENKLLRFLLLATLTLRIFAEGPVFRRRR